MPQLGCGQIDYAVPAKTSSRPPRRAADRQEPRGPSWDWQTWPGALWAPSRQNPFRVIPRCPPPASRGPHLMHRSEPRRRKRPQLASITQHDGRRTRKGQPVPAARRGCLSVRSRCDAGRTRIRRIRQKLTMEGISGRKPAKPRCIGGGLAKRELVLAAVQYTLCRRYPSRAR